jgi:hypothetical protein
MLPSPSSSPTQVLEPLTNTVHKRPLRQASLKFFPTPPNERKPKRQAVLTSGGSPSKRIKLTRSLNFIDDDASESSEGEYENSDDEDVFMAGPSTSRPPPRRVLQPFTKPASFYPYHGMFQVS